MPVAKNNLIDFPVTKFYLCVFQNKVGLTLDTTS